MTRLFRALRAQLHEIDLQLLTVFRIIIIIIIIIIITTTI
jgi:hypothetical protein